MRSRNSHVRISSFHPDIVLQVDLVTSIQHTKSILQSLSSANFVHADATCLMMERLPKGKVVFFMSNVINPNQVSRLCSLESYLFALSWLLSYIFHQEYQTVYPFWWCIHGKFSAQNHMGNSKRLLWHAFSLIFFLLRFWKAELFSC